MRHFLAIMGLCLLLLTGPASGQQLFQSGTHYQTLSTPLATTTGDHIEVREFFSYGCPHCHTFQPLVSQYADGLPDDVQLVHTPVVFNQAWQPLAQAYLTLEALGRADELHGAIFRAYHTERKPMRNVDEVARVFADLGVEDAQFRSAWNSFGVDGAMRQSDRLARSYRVQSTPSMAVNGKYLIDVRMAGGQAQMLRVVTYLVEQERQASQ